MLKLTHGATAPKARAKQYVHLILIEVGDDITHQSHNVKQVGEMAANLFIQVVFGVRV
jgi:hypothetical protein